MLVIVDGDPIVYRAGFAGESHTRRIVWSPSDCSEIFEEYFEPRDGKTSGQLKKEWLASFPEDVEPDILEEEVIVVPEELDHVLSTVKSMLRDTRYSVAEHHNVEPDDVILRVLLTGPGNFRDQIATVKPYKGNRKADHKPYWYQQIRNYLTDWWDAQVIEGREADDECAILQTRSNGKAVIATIDKDLDMVPGWHYDYVRKSHYHTTEDEGLALFYKQALKGDATDNICGAYKVGDKRANSFVDDYLLDHPGDWAGLWEAIVGVYRETLEKYGEACPYYGKEAEDVALEMARLVWMQREEGELWVPPGHPPEYLDLEFE